jgi:hypothetical protein
MMIIISPDLFARHLLDFGFDESPSTPVTTSPTWPPSTTAVTI